MDRDFLSDFCADASILCLNAELKLNSKIPQEAALSLQTALTSD